MKHRMILIVVVIALFGGVNLAKEKAKPRASTRTVVEGHPTSIRLAQHFTTTIRLPEPVNSVVVGDPGFFQAEHSPNEPLLVFVRPTSPSGESNLVVSTASGRQFTMLLKNGGEGFDSLVLCRTSGSAFIEENYPTTLIAETLALNAAEADKSRESEKRADSLAVLLKQQEGRQQNAPVGDWLKVDVGRTLHEGARFVVLFSVVNATKGPIELMPPQIQLAGEVKSGMFGRHAKWTTVDQIPVEEFEFTQRKLAAGARADGVLVFERPALKQSNERLLLQIAEASRVDQPVLAPITFSGNQDIKEGK
jgi:hypothetical protein